MFPHVAARELRALTDRLIAITCLQRGQQIRALQLPEVNTFTYLHVLTRTYAYLHVLTIRVLTRTYTYLHVLTRTYAYYLRVLTRTYTYLHVLAVRCLSARSLPMPWRRGGHTSTPARDVPRRVQNFTPLYTSRRAGKRRRASRPRHARRAAPPAVRSLHTPTHAYTYLHILTIPSLYAVTSAKSTARSTSLKTYAGRGFT